MPGVLSKMSEDEAYASDSVDHEIGGPGEILDILQVGEVFSYTIPSFSVISVQLRRIIISNYGRETTDEEIKDNPDAPSTIDVFLREDSRFNSLVVPTAIRVIDGCIVPVSTLSRAIPI